ncbi:hypothetical protein BS47DRAFT_141273 [Hydnum rufescens UP504]|uniref:Uncharacterized protein n=1 Tax=Hydnum rufescens UP504 TaxID=1448309 RepID=A0A9P6DSM8_9AGAM|nr:hypothetical protein BS47DRAFT_141273 [Hydnum rufescens UP504]
MCGPSLIHCLVLLTLQPDVSLDLLHLNALSLYDTSLDDINNQESGCESGSPQCNAQVQADISLSDMNNVGTCKLRSLLIQCGATGQYILW